MDCLFCKISNKEIDADILYEDEDVIGFRDIHPQAPYHILFIPRIHVSTLNELETEHATLVGKLTLAAKNTALKLGVAEDGYRILMNCNNHGGQTVFHIHLHLLAGRRMGWPPG
ncbi:MAG: histidine triad nucleotide-binding protein [Gammaproteobacteria bacterium]|nr:histidine triad nucleotide-binding protein [Gammaproteobacteria bacterium]